ncbi:hypothetical protein NW768_011134 [Fusarium equiseti]|uniref:F-box protein n=1 Tax=Fusarium equiseti TaxID=61235 RepID=A0ABQ8QYB6_FUSEQ|nr:hypothetical protein NW768_011134 [Fusarium equiseti]
MNRATRYALKSFEGTAPFTNLNIHESFLDLESLDALLTWPKNLQKLRLGYDMPMTEEWTFSHVQPMLETQMASLRELTITPAQDFGDIWNLDLTGFVKLEVLGLPSFVTGCDTVYIPSILAPNLRVFNWDFAYRSDSYVAVEDYDQAQEEWVDAMVDLAITRQKNLREIYINFEPCGYRSLRKVEGFVYPWDRLDESARVASKFGIRIRYNETNVSREAFEKWEM